TSARPVARAAAIVNDPLHERRCPLAGTANRPGIPVLCAFAAGAAATVREAKPLNLQSFYVRSSLHRPR
ncbi:MAG TPA: hypothetical protein VEZ20_00345, partial [Allosphingosinicella sp.]|nr:hypothetical protein [Allosphingosinicella sp.]